MKMNNTIIFGIGIVLLFALCLGYFIRQAKKSSGKDLPTRNTWYIFFPDKKIVPDLTKSEELKKFGKWKKTGKQLYSINGSMTLTKEMLEKAIKEEYKGIKFDISNTSELYNASVMFK